MRYLIVCITLLICVACRKDEVVVIEAPKPSYGRVGDNIKPMLFDVGSEWVYSNDTLQDTIRLTSVERRILLIWKHTEREVFTLGYESSQFSNFEENLFGAVISRSFQNDSWVYCTNISEGETNQNIKLLKRIESLTIGSNVYHNVTKVRVSEDFLIPNDMNLYYCDSVGIVRKEILSEESIIEAWDLVESNVSMYPYE